MGWACCIACGRSSRVVETPVVVVTGDQCLDDSVLAELRDLGADVRFKPLWIEDLVDVAKSLLQAHPPRPRVA